MLTSLRNLIGRLSRFDMLSILLSATLKCVSLRREERPLIWVIWLPDGRTSQGKLIGGMKGGGRGSGEMGQQRKTEGVVKGGLLPWLSKRGGARNIATPHGGGGAIDH
jgi:hypothetical protein